MRNRGPRWGIRARALSVLGAVVLVASSSPRVVVAQELPPCDDTTTASECQLPAWPDQAQIQVPSLFGDVSGTTWVEDVSGDAPAAGLDILAVGIGSVSVEDPAVIRDFDGLLKAGKVKEAVRPGENVVVRVVLDRPLDQVGGGHAGVHLVTDIDGSRSNNAPAGVVGAEQPFAGFEDVYSVTYATTTGGTKLLDSDLSQGWYGDDDPFAASWSADTVLELLVRPEAVGEGLRVVTFVSGDAGGYDSVGLGPGPIPRDGQVDLRPSCVEASIVVAPFVVRRLSENGQTLRNVEAPASWRGGGSFALDAESAAALESLIAASDDDGDGRIGLPSSVSVFEDGVVIGQRPEVQLELANDEALLALEFGLTRRGYELVREIDPEPTGVAVVDAWLERSLDALVEAMPPFRTGRRGGPLLGEDPGACIPALADAPGRAGREASPEPSPQGADGVRSGAPAF